MFKRLKHSLLILFVVLSSVVGLAGATVNSGEINQEQAIESLTGRFDAIIACGECQKLTVTDIQLCPPASRIVNVIRIPVIDSRTIFPGKVLINAHVLKIIFYRDIAGNSRIRITCIPVDCCIEVPGALPSDTIAFENIAVEFSEEELRQNGRILHEKMCVRVNVSIQRRFNGIPSCPLIP